MRIHRGRAVPLVGLLELKLAGEERVAPRGIEHEARPDERLAVRPGSGHGHPLAGRCEADTSDAGALRRPRAAPGGVREQGGVELGALHLPRVRVGRVQRVAEGEGAASARAVRYELGAGLAHTHRVHRIEHPEPLQHRRVARQQALADVEAGVRALLDEQHVAPRLREQGRRRGPGRTAADDQHVALGSILDRSRHGDEMPRPRGSGQAMPPLIETT